MRAWTVVLIGLVLAGLGQAEVVCSRDYGGTIVLGECWYRDGDSYYKTEDISTFTWTGGLSGYFELDADGLGAENFNVHLKPYVVTAGDAYYTIDEIKQMYPNVDFKQYIIQRGGDYKWGINITSIPEGVRDNIQYIAIQLEDATNINYDDVDKHSRKLVLKDTITIYYGDLIRAGYTLNLYNKTLLLIGNVTAQENLYLDPTVTLLSNESDYWEDSEIQSYNPNNNYGSAGYMDSGYYGAHGARKYRGVIDAQMPNGEGTISEIILSLYCSDSYDYATNFARTHELHELTTPFLEGEVTWNVNESGSNWGTAGGDYSATVIDSLSFNFDCGSSPQYYNWTLLGDAATNNVTYDWNDYFSLMLKEDDEDDDNWYAREVFEPKDGSPPPILYVTYEEGATTTTTTTTTTSTSTTSTTTTTSTSTTSTTTTSTTGTTIVTPSSTVTTTTLGSYYFQPVILYNEGGLSDTVTINVSDSVSHEGTLSSSTYAANNYTDWVFYLEGYDSFFNYPYYLSAWDSSNTLLYDSVKGRVFGDSWDGNLNITGNVSIQDYPILEKDDCSGGCAAGMIAWNSSHICVCTSADTWKAAKFE